MHPHLITFVFSSAFGLLFFASISASHNGLTNGDPTKGGGYRCGKIIISQHLIDRAAEEAANWPYHDVTQDSNHEISISPIEYYGHLKFPTNLRLFLWPVSLLGQIYLDTDSYYIVLGKGLLNFFGVIWQHGDSIHEKCIKESDISDVLGHNYALGYRCPHTIYPFEKITTAILSLKSASPAPFVGENIFDEYMPLYQWPISPDGNFDHTAADFIIMDDNFNLIGMVYKRKKGYFRCRLTIKHKITSEFVGRALEQKPEIFGRNSQDMFQCHKYSIPSNRILAAVTIYRHSIEENMEDFELRDHSALYKITGYFGPLPLYQISFKVTVLKGEKYAKESGLEKLVLIVDDFANVYNIRMIIDENQILECERKAKYRGIEKYNPLSPFGLVNKYRTSIENALAKESYLHIEYVEGERGVESSRARKKQKSTF